MKNFDSKLIKVGSLNFTEYFLNDENTENIAANILKEHFHENTKIYEVELSHQDLILFEREKVNIKKFTQKEFVEYYSDRGVSIYSLYLCYFEVQINKETQFDKVLKKNKKLLFKELFKKCYSPFEDLIKGDVFKELIESCNSIVVAYEEYLVIIGKDK